VGENRSIWVIDKSWLFFLYRFLTGLASLSLPTATRLTGFMPVSVAKAKMFRTGIIDLYITGALHLFIILCLVVINIFGALHLFSEKIRLNN